MTSVTRINNILDFLNQSKLNNNYPNTFKALTLYFAEIYSKMDKDNKKIGAKEAYYNKGPGHEILKSKSLINEDETLSEQKYHQLMHDIAFESEQELRSSRTAIGRSKKIGSEHIRNLLVWELDLRQCDELHKTPENAGGRII